MREAQQNFAPPFRGVEQLPVCAPKGGHSLAPAPRLSPGGLPPPPDLLLPSPLECRNREEVLLVRRP
eukprot:500926-Alexandrium_andersonii.AAC.1